MAKVRKALIPAAGFGTRFLPATKTIPKEMFPIVDKPILLWLVEELVRGGIEDIIIVAGRNKTAIEDFFDCSYELEDSLAKAGKEDLLNQIKDIKNMANIISIRQKQALGLGHAVLSGQPIIGDEPFAVALGDEIMMSDPKTPAATQELTEAYEKTSVSTVAVMKVATEDVQKYGIVDVEQGEHGMKIKNVIEKPSPENAPSQWALPGRYVFDAKIFDAIKNLRPGKNGEIQLTDAMTTLAKSKGMFAKEVQATRFDAGDKFGFLQANLHYGLQHPEIKERLKTYLKSLVKEL